TGWAGSDSHVHGTGGGLRSLAGRVELAHKVATALTPSTSSALSPRTEPGMSRDERRAAQDAYDQRVQECRQAQDELVRQYGSVEKASTALGAAVAERGEELAGITGQQAREALTQRQREAQMRLNELKQRAEQLEQDLLKGHNEEQEAAQIAVMKAMNAWRDDPGNDELRKAKDAAEARWRQVKHENQPTEVLAKKERIGREALDAE